MNPQDIEVQARKPKREEVTEWVCTQIETALRDRQQFMDRVKKWIKQYEEILPKKKTFPWEGCSNISVPQTPINVETQHERECNVVLNNRPYLQIKPKKVGVNKDTCAALEKFLDQIFSNVVDGYNKCSDWFLEKNKMGTGFLKVHWIYDRRKVGGRYGYFREVDDAALEVIDIEDLIFPVNAKDIQSCSFVSHRFRKSLQDLLCKKAQGVYRNIDKIKGFQEASPDSMESSETIKREKEDVERLQRTAPDVLQEYELHEVYFEYDVDGDGYSEQMVMTVHIPTRTVLRWIYHPFDHGRRPFVENWYIRRTNRVLGKGLCEISEHIQDALNTVFNQVIDNATIANVKCFKGRKTAERDIGKVYPGKTFWLDDPTDLEEFSLGDVHQSNFAIHETLRNYIERRTKITDYTTGRESSITKSRATATGTLALLQESGKHFDLIINNTRKAMTEVGYQLIELYIQYRPDKIFAVTGDQDALVNISLPKGLDIKTLREEYNFHCAATSLAVNKEIEKQSNLLLLQQLAGIFEKMIQLLMLAFSPQVPIPDDLRGFIISIVTVYYRLAEDLVRSFEKIDVDEYLPELPAIIQQAYGQNQNIDQMMQMFGGMLGGTPGTQTVAPGTNIPTGMEGVFGAAEGTPG